MTKQLKVLVVGGDGLIESMFLRRGFTIVNRLGGEDPDLVQFTGGEDVSPSLYGHVKHPSTFSNPRRDEMEVNIFHQFVGKVPLAGICRGGQLLNVLNGGTMYQHIDQHGRYHKAIDVETKQEIPVASTHHQMMSPTPEAQVLMEAFESNIRWIEERKVLRDPEVPDIEALYYKETNSLCFQPHPEYLDLGDPGQEIYFDYLKKYSNIG